MRVDRAKGGPLAAHLIDEQREQEKDRGTRQAVPKARRHRDPGPSREVGEDPRDSRQERDEHRGVPAQPPAREPDGDQVEDGEAVLGTRRNVDEPDRSNAERGKDRERKDLPAAAQIKIAKTRRGR